MVKFTTNWLTTIFPNYKGKALDSINIYEVFTDSRKKAKFSLFVPIVGENFDAHDYLKDAINMGAVASLWQKDKEIPRFLPTDFPLFFVEDTIVAMQQLAMAYREHVDPKVIGITGSNGKTTTKDFFAKVFETTYKTEKTKGNFNNHIGLPLTILSMEPNTEVLILEMGMNHFGEIETLSNIAKPDIAVITNIGESHIEYLGSREGIAKAKSEITSGLKENGKLIIDGDERLLQILVNKYDTVRIGFNKENDVVIENVGVNNDGTVFTIEDQSFEVPLLGRHQAKNAAFAIIAARFFGLDDNQIRDGLKNVELTGMRFEKIETKEGAILINDAYNASATSMKASIEVVKEMNANRKVLILGDILELGEHSKSFHRSIAEVITPPIHAVYTYGVESEEILKELKKRDSTIQTFAFQSKEKLTKELRKELKADTLLLFKASRGMKLESIIEQLSSGE
ncbi:UDP-N-acetylmuramoyl-tripeptide--D-alanyl-D-alanine ligase [Salirhabdus euzebyi]|uniref:UDP-N-acetylmuramoyl-tripeptide--D-alanyl-D-alanine ligase n=1 Tax=Salirhabdus euzebyi TaxID=394506 RepID=A0A841Q9W2_9BACI|nr:UDP-N-acetylmuramoyl-tripeptide--D-alanyl-D-alanine ligase [Salirhabdus euzebyi]MBB6455027.1 UDP-N-acetylmuramoyl-tripeptide--D-alanyl-D-alanine ligase [Salirhabdus euzebyi]